MGGASTEIDAGSTDIVIEAAHFDATTIARSARRHKLPSEASRRFARGRRPRVARGCGRAGGRRCSPSWVGRLIDPGRTVVAAERASSVVLFDPQAASRLVGVEFSDAAVAGYLKQDRLSAHIGGWRPFEVTIPTVAARPHRSAPSWSKRWPGCTDTSTSRPSCPQRRSAAGLTYRQRLRRRVGLALAGAGYVEVQTLSLPFAAGARRHGSGIRR